MQSTVAFFIRQTFTMPSIYGGYKWRMASKANY